MALMPKLKLRPGPLPVGISPLHPAAIVATWFWAGRMPMAAGTWGSLAALPFAWVVQTYWGLPGMIVALIAITAAGIWASNVMVERGDVRDPGFIVVDEVAGMFLTLLAAPRCGGHIWRRSCCSVSPTSSSPSPPIGATPTSMAGSG